MCQWPAALTRVDSGLLYEFVWLLSQITTNLVGQTIEMCFLSYCSGGEKFEAKGLARPVSFQKLVGNSFLAFSGFWKSLACGCFTLVSAATIPRVFLLFIYDMLLDLGPTLIQDDLNILRTSLHLQRPLFQIRPHVQVLGGPIFWRALLQPTTPPEGRMSWVKAQELLNKGSQPPDSYLTSPNARGFCENPVDGLCLHLFHSQNL